MPGIRKTSELKAASACSSMPTISETAPASGHTSRPSRSHWNTHATLTAIATSRKMYMRAVCE